MRGSGEGSGEISNVFPERGWGAAVWAAAWLSEVGASERAWQRGCGRREAAGWRRASWRLGPGPGGRVRPVGPGLLVGEQDPEAGAPCGPGLIV